MYTIPDETRETWLMAEIPTILADNGGYDSSDLVTKLRAAHYEGRADAGLGKSIFHILLHNRGLIL